MSWDGFCKSPIAGLRLYLPTEQCWNFRTIFGRRARNRVGIGLSYRPARTQICKRLKNPRIDFKDRFCQATLAGGIDSLKMGNGDTQNMRGYRGGVCCFISTWENYCEYFMQHSLETLYIHSKTVTRAPKTQSTFFLWARVYWPFLCFCRLFCILDSNPESCRSKQVRVQFSHPYLISSRKVLENVQLWAVCELKYITELGIAGHRNRGCWASASRLMPLASALQLLQS